MRILQIIDSLETGGAERMAVNYANALADIIPFSGLAATRSEGILKTDINPNVNYVFVGKKWILYISALIRLHKYCRMHEVSILHAHSSSYFFVLMLKCLTPKFKIVWHDHNGISEFLTSREAWILKIASYF